MAARSMNNPLHNLVPKTGPITKPISRVMMLANNEFPIKKTTSLQIMSLKNQVFEDRSTGIICYRDESGQIICEGYDEGPRFHQKISTTLFHPRDVEISNLLQQNWLKISRGGAFYQPDIGIALLEDLNRNDSNSG